MRDRFELVISVTGAIGCFFVVGIEESPTYRVIWAVVASLYVCGFVLTTQDIRNRNRAHRCPECNQPETDHAADCLAVN